MNFYEQLGVARDASVDEIERAFRQLARQVHPDLNSGDPKGAARRMQQLNELRDTLTDPARRAIYDASLDAPGPAPGPLPHPHWDAAPYVPEAVDAEDVSAPTRGASFGRLVGLALGAAVIASTIALLTRRPVSESNPAPGDVGDGGLGLVTDAPPLLAVPKLAATPPTPAAPTPSARPGRVLVRIGSRAEDVIRKMGAPDRVEPGRHPSETVFRYGRLRLELTNGRVTGGDAAYR